MAIATARAVKTLDSDVAPNQTLALSHAPTLQLRSSSESPPSHTVENCLLPTLHRGQVVVMDNATFHKGGRISQLIQDAGCQLLYLPPYSPDLNKIERCWSWLKSRIHKQLDQFDCLRDAIEDVLRLVS